MTSLSHSIRGLCTEYIKQVTVTLRHLAWCTFYHLRSCVCGWSKAVSIWSNWLSISVSSLLRLIYSDQRYKSVNLMITFVRQAIFRIFVYLFIWYFNLFPLKARFRLWCDTACTFFLGFATDYKQNHQIQVCRCLFCSVVSLFLQLEWFIEIDFLLK